MPNTSLLSGAVALVREGIITAPPFDAALLVTPIADSFVAGPSTDYGALTPANFTGGASKSSGTGYLLIFLPATQKWYIYIPEPAGGWKWVCTAAPVDTETIYGVFVDNIGGFNIPPTPITNVGDTVLVGDILVELPQF